MERDLIAGLDKQTTRVILASSGVLLGWSFVSSVWSLGPITASIITYALYGFYWFYAIRHKNPLVMRLVIFGTVAGLLELVTDHYLVDTINSLVYPNKELMIWSSPAYMPFAWSNVILQLGFIGVLLTRKFGILKASIMLGIAGGMYIPLYEHLANNAGWWWYKKNTLMVFNAPVYVIVCEALISLSLPWLIQHAENHSVKKTLALGGIVGIWILMSAYIAFSIAG
ncbi:hypothetical protein SAMN04488029_0476 [Reichenbachiella faecimaris]|uniref:DUF6989 domain-containing protein n=1 Tax=Reichenbachiella faecimaris TaxID=692418 RepID=A0A1W2G758_REIFA|nr:hypothetical protein [Reichenbachiella faecimaris]SMD32136.1 hypothetical protein SAMN04488029_0476 [Reichenbachiella faecimaris]